MTDPRILFTRCTRPSLSGLLVEKQTYMHGIHMVRRIGMLLSGPHGNTRVSEGARVHREIFDI